MSLVLAPTRSGAQPFVAPFDALSGPFVYFATAIRFRLLAETLSVWQEIYQCGYFTQMPIVAETGP
jgi:hypothetical protein